MNRYAAFGMHFEASLGKSIMVLTVDGLQNQEAVDVLAASAMDGARVTLLNGGERIDYPGGGRIVIRRWRDGTSRHRPDVVYLDDGVERVAWDLRCRESLYAEIAANGQPEVISA